MADSRTLALHATLPQRYARFDVLASTIDHRGRLLALLVDPARNGTKDRPWHRRKHRAAPSPPFDAIAVLCEGNDEHEIPLYGLDQRFGAIDALGEGVVLGAARIDSHRGVRPPEQCAPAEESDPTRNVVVFDGAGERTGAFYAGDAITQLLTDPSGRIWISYLDEACYRIVRPDGTWVESFDIGLARWDDPDSTPWFAYEDTGRQVCWCDCYSLNVGRTLTHACPYTDFPLVEMDASGVRSITPNPITRCTALAVADSELAFLDQVGHKRKRIWTIRKGRRRDGVVTETGTELLELPGGRTPTAWARGKIGRDATIWMHQDGNPRRWYRYEIDC